MPESSIDPKITIAACAFAAVLYKVVNSGPVMSALQSLVEDALDAKF
ncbi:DUF4244 domain-containing protein [Streptomyces anulatus]|uniref:DUF4244 domain-containing protein n=1 Tax=Streptomyces anulatus TaxID=1892 RepID=A0ABZ1ZH89_STRAQ